MKPSEAIRIGAKNRPQIKEDFFNCIEKSKHCSMVGSCALGAMHEGLRGSTCTENISELHSLFDGYSNTINPVSGCSQGIYSAIIHLNDKCGWTREQIADWLEKEFDL